MVDKQASSCIKDTKGAPDNVVDQLSVPVSGPSNLSATAQDKRNRLADKEAALVSCLAAVTKVASVV